MERVMGIEPTRPAWKAGILAIELHPQNILYYNTTNRSGSQEFSQLILSNFHGDMLHFNISLNWKTKGCNPIL